MRQKSLKRGFVLFEEGLRHYNAQDFKQAKGCFEAAARLLPGDPDILCNLGLTLSQLEEWDRAKTCHRRALDEYKHA